MSHADWFARKMGTGTTTRQPAVPQMPPAVNGLRLPAQQPQHQLTGVQQAHPEAGVITGQENFQGLINAAHANGDQVTFTKLSRHWKGGEALRTEGHIRCPGCGGYHLFTRSNVRVMNESGATGHAKPRCFDCGWQEGFTPGDKANWG